MVGVGGTGVSVGGSGIWVGVAGRRVRVGFGLAVGSALGWVVFADSPITTLVDCD